MQDTAPPGPAGSVSSPQRQRHGPVSPPTSAATVEGAVVEAVGSTLSAPRGVAGGNVALANDAETRADGEPAVGLPVPADSGVGGRVLVLNATYEPINVCSIRRAVVLLLKDKAEMIERGARHLHAESVTLARPVVIRLVTYVRVPRQARRRKITRRAVFARDGWACQYCGSRSNLTVDHVIPRSKGGSSSWDNIVASCGPCNRRKGDQLLEQLDMELRQLPRTPRAEIFIHVSAPTIPTAWQPYLAEAA